MMGMFHDPTVLYSCMVGCAHHRQMALILR